MIKWPGDLVKDIARRRSVLFLGAGVSKNASNRSGERPKDWVEFLTLGAQQLDPIKQTLVTGLLSQGDLLTACELLRTLIGPSAFKSLLLEEYSGKGFKGSKVHEDIALLDSRFVVTTNFDKLYEQTANNVQDNTVRTLCYYDDDAADALRRSDRVVWKIHGTIDLPNKTIFTRADYAKARIANAHFYKLFESLLLTHTFIFLGASMRDPDIQLILENHAYQFTGSRPHFLVTPKGITPDEVMTVTAGSINVEPVFYDGANNHQELADGLVDLVEQVGSARQDLLDTLDW